MGSQRSYVCGRIDPGCDNGHTSWIHLGSVGWCTSLYFDILQIPFSFSIVGTARGTGLILDVDAERLIIVSLDAASGRVLSEGWARETQ